MIRQPLEHDLDAWRPQRFGGRPHPGVTDPLIEPLWIGDRVLAHLPDAAGAARLVAVDGTHLTDPAAAAEIGSVAAALADALRAEHAVVDGYLTRMASQPGEGHLIDPIPPRSAISLRRLFLGESEGRREAERRAATEQAIARFEEDGLPLAFVAVDLLELDGVSLLDLPLLERKRLLESALAESEQVRIGPYVRHPAERWYGTWQATGFLEIALKGANSRYRPGETNDEWAIAPIPRR